MGPWIVFTEVYLFVYWVLCVGVLPWMGMCQNWKASPSQPLGTCSCSSFIIISFQCSKHVYLGLGSVPEKDPRDFRLYDGSLF